MRMRSCLVASLLVLAASGCNQVSLVDDIDLALDFHTFTGPFDSLHSPYVQGSAMSIFVQRSDSRENMVGWTIESEDPSVFTISDVSNNNKGNFSAVGHARSAGFATIVIRDHAGAPQHTRKIEVALPDRVELFAHGLLIIGRDPSEATISEARVQQGGTATYLARYFRGSDLLSGNGALTVEPPAGVTAQVQKTFLFEDRDWLQLSPGQTGNFSVGLVVGGVHIQDLPLTAVPSSDVASLRLLGMDESHAHRGDHLVVLAQASDAQTRTVYGVEYAWQLDNQAQLGLGDLYRYDYVGGAPRMLTANFGNMTSTVAIHGTGFVDSTNNVGCSYGGGTRPSPLSLPLVALFTVAIPLGIARRRLRLLRA